MSAHLQSFIADFLHRRSIVDPDDFAGRASTLFESDSELSEETVFKKLQGVRTQLFRRNQDYSKKELLQELARRINGQWSTIRVTAPNACEECVVLFLASAPWDESRLALDSERRSIEQRLRGASKSSRLRFVDKWAVHPLDLLQCVNEVEPDVVHFSGHGSGPDGLVFTSEDGVSAALVDGDTLSEVFAQFRKPPKVVLMNACYSEDQAQAILKVAKCVIGMSDSIGDDAAAEFSSHFYQAIGSGRSVYDAFVQARLSLKLAGDPDHDIAILVDRPKGAAKKLVLLPADSNS